MLLGIIMLGALLGCCGFVSNSLILATKLLWAYRVEYTKQYSKFNKVSTFIGVVLFSCITVLTAITSLAYIVSSIIAIVQVIR